MGKFFYSWYFIYPTRSKQWHSSKNEKKSYHTRFGIQKDEKGGGRQMGYWVKYSLTPQLVKLKKKI